MKYIVLASPPACWGGPLPSDNASDHFNNLSRDDQNLICQNLRAPGRTDTSCPAFKTLLAECERRPKTPENECDPKKVCEAISKALKAVSDAQTGIGSASLRYTRLKQELSPLLDQIRAALCDDSRTRYKQNQVNEVGRLLNSLSFVAGQPNTANVERLAEMTHLLNRIEWACRECKEQKTPPWFDATTKCDGELRAPDPGVKAVVHTNGVMCSQSWSVCGTPMTMGREQFFDTGFITTLKGGVTQQEADRLCASKGFGRETVPYRPICCPRWRQAELEWLAFRRKYGPDAPGHPCNPTFDSDCDDTNNTQDPTPLGGCATDYPRVPSSTPMPSARSHLVPATTQIPWTFQPFVSQYFGTGVTMSSNIVVLPVFWAREVWDCSDHIATP